MKPTLARALGFAAAFLLPAAAAASPSARLVYGRGVDTERCPDEAALRRAVAARVGYDPFFPHAPRTIVLTIVRRDGDLVARLDLVEEERASASRELVSSEPGCEELFQSAALAIAIAIDPRVLAGPSSAPPAASDAPAPAHAPAALTPPPPDPAAEERDVVRRRPDGTSPAGRLRITLGARGAAGLQPSVTPGAFGGASVVWRRASIGGEIGTYVPGVATGASGAQARVWLVSGALLSCLRFEPLSVCGVFSAGRFEASGERVVGSRSDVSSFIAVGGRTGIELSLSKSFRAHLDGELLGNLTRATVKVGPETIWKAPPIAFSLAAALSFTFDGGATSPRLGANRGRLAF